MKINKLNESTKFKVNDKVFVKPNKKQGKVLKVKGDYITVEMDNGIDPIRIDTYYDTDLEAVDEIKESSYEDHLDIILRKTSGYYKCYKIVKKAMTSKPVDIEALEDARDHFGYDLYKMCLDDVSKEMENLDESKHITEARRKASDPKQIEKAENAMFDSLMNGASDSGWMINDAKMIYGLSYDEAVKAFRNAHNKYMSQKDILEEDSDIYYVTIYEEDQRYNPEEGGYVSTGWSASKSIKFKGKESALKYQQEFIEGSDILNINEEDNIIHIIDEWDDEYLIAVEDSASRGKSHNPAKSWAEAEFDDGEPKKVFFDDNGNRVARDPKEVEAERKELEDTFNLLKDEISKADDVKSIMDIANDEKFDKIRNRKHTEYWDVIIDRVSEINKSMNESSNAYTYKGYTIIDTGYGCKIKDSYGKWGRVQFDTTDEAEEYIDDMKLNETYWIDNKDIMDKVKELSNQLESEGWMYREDKYTGSKYYVIFQRRGENGAEFRAVKYNHNHAPEIVELTMDQIIGKVPLDSFDGLRKKLTKMLMPENWFEDDGNFFTKEELVDFGNEIVEHLNEIFDAEWELTGAYEDGKEIEIEVSSDDVGTYTHSIKVDFRKIKKPSDINKYIMDFVAKFNEQIRKDIVVESINGTYSLKAKELIHKAMDNGEDISGIIDEIIRYANESDMKDVWFDKLRHLVDDEDTDILSDNLLESSEDIPTETLPGPEEGPKAGLSELISMAIKDEWDAIETYNTLSIAARAEGFEDIAKISDEIGTEENKHVGQLQVALKTISPNAEAIGIGEEEGNNQLEG